MPTPYQPGSPDSQSIAITFPDSDNVVLDRWTSYDFSSDFLTPADNFTFTLGLDEDGLPEEEKSALRFGARIRLTIDGKVLSDGRVDAMEINADRSSGHTVSIRGRDRLGQTLDAVVDPRFQVKPGATVADL